MNDAGEQLYIYEIEDQLKEARENLLKGTELMNRATLELEANKKEIAESIPKENVMNLAREIRSKQDEAIAEECFAESDIYGEVFDQIVKLLNNKEGE